jgi:hypothetical protein
MKPKKIVINMRMDKGRNSTQLVNLDLDAAADF